MSQLASKLRLGPLPKTQTIKTIIACSVTLKADLDRYAALPAQTYGEPVDAATLIPQVLAAFIAWDRGFKKTSGHAVVDNSANKASLKQASGLWRTWYLRNQRRHRAERGEIPVSQERTLNAYLETSPWASVPQRRPIEADVELLRIRSREVAESTGKSRPCL